MSRILAARWILPIDRPPIERGWIEIADGRIVRARSGTPPGPVEDLGDVVLMPGLVNAHTHLELSWMAGRVPPARSMDQWIRALMALRRSGQSGGADEEARAARDAAASMAAGGTSLVGDISNSLMSPLILAAAGLSAVIFHELLGFRAADPEAMVRDAWARVDVLSQEPALDGFGWSVVPHAPYSVSPALFGAIAGARRGAPLSVHLGESPEEIEFLERGTGPIRSALEDLGVWSDDWSPPRTSPMAYLLSTGYRPAGSLIVHGGHLPQGDLEILRALNATLVTCPRSNVWVGAGPPPVSRFYRSGVRVAIGTDSLASAASLSMFDEMAAVAKLAPEVPPREVLKSATLIGAEALGCARDFGSLGPGTRATFALVEVPADVTDVEEYLVSGVPAEAVRRLSIST